LPPISEGQETSLPPNSDVFPQLFKIQNFSYIAYALMEQAKKLPQLKVYIDNFWKEGFYYKYTTLKTGRRSIQSNIERKSKVISLIKIQNSIPKHLIYVNLGFCLKYLTFLIIKTI